MAYNHMYMGPTRSEDYNTFNNVAIQATVNTFFPPPTRVIPQGCEEQIQRDVGPYQREGIQIHREDIPRVSWDGKYVNENVKYVHVNQAPKYIHLNESQKYPQLNENLRYVPVDQNVKYHVPVTENTMQTCTRLPGSDLSKFRPVIEGVNYAQGNETVKYASVKAPLFTPPLFTPKYEETIQVREKTKPSPAPLFTPPLFTPPLFTPKYEETIQVREKTKPSPVKETAPKRSHECDVCGKHLSSVGALKTHMLIHSQEKPFACHICDKRFASSTGQQRHIISHAGLRSYKCDLCEKTFVLKSALRQHEQIHKGIKKPYICEICNCSFRFPFRLKEHQRTHSGERPFVCGICGKSFRVNRLLAKHKDIHTGKVKKYNLTPKRKGRKEECPVCTLKFADVPQHLKTHYGIKAFRCPICQKTFKRKQNTKTHMLRTHGRKSPLPGIEEVLPDCIDSNLKDTADDSQTEKTFKCNTCSRMFALEWSLRMHKTLVHKPSE